MNVRAERAPVADILPMREEHRREMACQIVHDSLHERGMTDPYLLSLEGRTVGYGTVVGFGDDPRQTVDELWIRREDRGSAGPLFRALVEASAATRVQAQTNDPLLMLMLFDCAGLIERDRILFEDGFATRLAPPGACARPVTPDDADRTIGGKRLAEAGDWLVEAEGEVVAAGGILHHYNPPFADLYMEVAPSRRRRGYGSYLVQELKRACYESEKVPAARCGAENVASRATLQRGGMLPCGGIVTGVIGA